MQGKAVSDAPLHINCVSCSQHPDTQGDHQTADSVSASWDFIPSKVLSELPPLLATVCSRSNCGWTEVSAHSELWPHRELPCARSRCFSLTPCGGLGASAIVAFRAIGGMGKVFDGLAIWLSRFNEGGLLPKMSLCIRVSAPGRTPSLTSQREGQKYKVQT